MSTGKIGRPKKSISTDPSKFHRIVDTPKHKSSVVEFCNTEPFPMSKYLKTLKSNRIPAFYIACRKDKVIFWGKVTPKQYSHEYASDTNNHMYLIYECTNIYRYYCKRDTFISITDKESIISLLGEISESSNKIKMVINSFFTDQIEFTISNGALKCKYKMCVKCDIEFDKPEKIPKISMYPTKTAKLYCEMSYIDTSECKKDLNTKFKKKVVENKIQFTPDFVTVYHKKDIGRISESIWKTTKPEDVLPGSQSIVVNVDKPIEMNYPKSCIVNFLLHIKGKFHIMFYENVIILVFREDNIIMISELSIDSS